MRSRSLSREDELFSFVLRVGRYAYFDDGITRAELLRYAACPDISDPKIENKHPAICVLSSLLHAP